MLREMRTTDVPFVFNSWLESWRVNKYAGCIPNNLYYATTRSNIENLIARGSTIKVACLADDEDCILGWVCSEVLKDGNSCVHFIYVKDPYLTHGIGEKLASTLPERGFFTYRTTQTEQFFPKYTWAPEIARRK